MIVLTGWLRLWRGLTNRNSVRFDWDPMLFLFRLFCMIGGFTLFIMSWISAYGINSTLPAVISCNLCEHPCIGATARADVLATRDAVLPHHRRIALNTSTRREHTINPEAVLTFYRIQS